MMIKTFVNEEIIVKSKSKFGTFFYDINVSRELPGKYFFDREVARECLLYIHEIFKEKELSFFLIFGTALGAVREKNFILHDVDIDLGIFYKDKVKLVSAIKELLEKYNFKVLKISVKEESITLIYKKIVVDIGLFQKKNKFYIYNDFYENKIPLKMLEQLEKISFLEQDFYLPSPSDKYLVHQYGRNWRKPIKNWNYLNKYISKNKFTLLQKYKQNLKKNIKKIISKVKISKHKFYWLNNVLKDLNIYSIVSIEQSGQGFCDTFIIKADKSVVIKKNNQNRFNYFKKDFLSYEPIYEFMEFNRRFEYEKNIFEKINNKDVLIKDDIIIFPYIKSKSLSYYLEDEKFFVYLEKAFFILRDSNIKHGDFHIENILVSDDKVYLIDFEMTFSDYLTIDEQYYYDIYFFFAKLEYQYPNFYDKNFLIIKEFIQNNFSKEDRNKIIQVANKTKQYFFNINGAKIDLFDI